MPPAIASSGNPNAGSRCAVASVVIAPTLALSVGSSWTTSAPRRLVRHGREDAHELAWPTNLDDLQIDLQRSRGALHGGEKDPVRRVHLIEQDGRPDQGRQGFPRQLEPLRGELGVEERQPSEVSPRPGKARDQAKLEQVAETTIGMVDVACLAASTPGVPWVTITSTLRLTRSAARSGSRS